MPKTNDVEFIIKRCKAHGLSKAQCAYVLATVQHETNGQYIPVREAYWLSENWRKANLRYYPWYGRGYVQTTWEPNYRRTDNHFGLKGALMKNPDLLITDKQLAADAMIIGMMRGWYGSALVNHVNSTKKDYFNARRSVNILDKASLIAQYAVAWEKGYLTKIGY